jgi:signal transduction histidine kinase
MSSLRSRLMLGAVLWTFGLLAGITMIFTVSAHARNSMMVVHAHNHITFVVTLALLAAGLVVVRRAIRPIEEIRSRLAEVQSGVEQRLKGDYPTEVRPLVDDLNALIAHSQQVVTRAIAKSGDLAHGLKTPLAILSNEAEHLVRSGQGELAGTITQQVSLMQRQIDYHLAHARAAASGAALHTQTPVAASADGLRRTMTQLHHGRCLEIETDVHEAHAFRGRREDLDEMLGNLLDNACKWAKSRVRIASQVTDRRVTIAVDDDGPGIDPSRRQAVLNRGVRADEAVPGSGLGLAIVRDLAELYGGSIALDRSPLGGLRAILTLPSA